MAHGFKKAVNTNTTSLFLFCVGPAKISVAAMGRTLIVYGKLPVAIAELEPMNLLSFLVIEITASCRIITNNREANKKQTAQLWNTSNTAVSKMPDAGSVKTPFATGVLLLLKSVKQRLKWDSTRMHL